MHRLWYGKHNSKRGKKKICFWFLVCCFHVLMSCFRSKSTWTVSGLIHLTHISNSITPYITKWGAETSSVLQPTSPRQRSGWELNKPDGHSEWGVWTNQPVIVQPLFVDCFECTTGRYLRFIWWRHSNRGHIRDCKFFHWEISSDLSKPPASTQS